MIKTLNQSFQKQEALTAHFNFTSNVNKYLLILSNKTTALVIQSLKFIYTKSSAVSTVYIVNLLYSYHLAPIFQVS